MADVVARSAVVIQDMLDSGDFDGLSRFIFWKGDVCCYRIMEGSGADYPFLGEAIGRIDPVEDLFRPDDVVIPARFLVQDWINKQLKGNAGPHLRYDVRTGRQVLQILPSTLLSAMWLQFAQSIAGDKKHHLCPVCGRWFEVAPTGVIRSGKSRSPDGPGRMNRVFCSDPCKSKDYRDRKSQAAKAKTTKKRITKKGK
jgi:hypothetical protein